MNMNPAPHWLRRTSYSGIVQVLLLWFKFKDLLDSMKGEFFNQKALCIVKLHTHPKGYQTHDLTLHLIIMEGGSSV